MTLQHVVLFSFPRELTEDERADLHEPRRARAEAMYPQRRAVLFALVELTEARGTPPRRE